MSKNTNLRVISGELRGRILKSPELSTTHPMGAREKLALFNMVNVENMTVLDAFAGTGALGIEASSRGAREVVFVENDRRVAKILQENLTNLDIDDQVVVTKVSNFANNPQNYNRFNVILADPPYDGFNLAEISSLAQLLQNDGIMALSSPKELGEVEIPNLRLSSTHTYARARITIYYKET